MTLPLLVWLAGHALARAHQTGTVQLIGHVDQAGASLNGAAVHFNTPPIQIEGRTMLPAAETLGLFGLALNLGAAADSIGGLSFSPALDSATFDGTVLQVEGNFAKRGDEIYIRAGLLAQAIGGRLTAGEHGEFYLTLVRNAAGDPNLPQPRFTTDKDVYAIGEPVKIEEYSFDPLGGNVFLHWTNLQPAYFKPGPETITLEASNREGRGNRIARTITITNRILNSPLEYSLKYGAVGDLMDDVSTAYPTLPRLRASNVGTSLLVSDSPESVSRTGAMFRDTVSAPFRLVAYHVNGSESAARLCVLVKNIDSQPGTFRTVRMGDTAPERIEGVLGQVTLLSFLTDHEGARYELAPGECALLYLSPVLAPKAGASVLADFSCDRRYRVTVAMTLGEAPLAPDSIAVLDTLPLDGRHVRGVFPAAARAFSLDLNTRLPAKAVIGDTTADPPERGRDPISGAPEVLDGNYGVTYEITLNRASGVVGAIAPRGGLYKGTVVVQDLSTGNREIVRLPREGVLAAPDKEMIFLRSSAQNVRLEFIPASGSELPVHLVFYRP